MIVAPKFKIVVPKIKIVAPSVNPALSGVYTRGNDMIGEAGVKRLSSTWRPQLFTLI